MWLQTRWPGQEQSRGVCPADRVVPPLPAGRGPPGWAQLWGWHPPQQEKVPQLWQVSTRAGQG